MIPAFIDRLNQSRDVNMGQYWWCAFYYGRLLSQGSYTRLLNSDLVKNNPGILDRFLERDQLVDHHRGWRILHLPGHFQRVGFVNPVLEPQEFEAGRVEWSEVTCVADKWFKDFNPEDMKMLTALIRAAAPPRYVEDKLRPGWCIFQATWWTLEAEKMHELCAEANISVVGCPHECYTNA